MKLKFYSAWLVSLSLALMIFLGSGLAHAETNPGIAPIQSQPYGASYSEWAARYRKWVLETPASINPAIDTTGQNCTVHRAVGL